MFHSVCLMESLTWSSYQGWPLISVVAGRMWLIRVSWSFTSMAWHNCVSPIRKSGLTYEGKTIELHGGFTCPENCFNKLHLAWNFGRFTVLLNLHASWTFNGCIFQYTGDISFMAVISPDSTRTVHSWYVVRLVNHLHFGLSIDAKPSLKWRMLSSQRVFHWPFV
jgi:hypothetical protein